MFGAFRNETFVVLRVPYHVSFWGYWGVLEVLGVLGLLWVFWGLWECLETFDGGAGNV